MKKTERKRVKMWTVVFAINAIVLYFAFLLFPAFVVLGNDSLSVIAALAVTSLLLTLILTQVYPVVKVLKLKTDSDLFLSFAYIIANIGGLWLISRGALYTGFGISSFVVAIELGIILTILQYFLRKKFVRGK